MITTNPGTRGATRETWRTMPLRSLLQHIIEEHPTWTRDDQCKLYVERVSEDPRLTEEAARRCFDNDYMNLIRMRPAPRPKSGQPSPEFIAIRDHFFKTMLSMDFILPNGRRLQDATGAYLVSLSADHLSLGAVYARLGERIGPDQRLGDVFSQDDITQMAKEIVTKEE